VYFVRLGGLWVAYHDKKLSVFVRFRAPLLERRGAHR
jgi:hypothetical protein